MSRFVSLMVPLDSGQSRQMLLEKCVGNDQCQRCRDEASVFAEDGQLYIVGDCTSCAFKASFINGLGIRITCNISVERFYRNEYSYSVPVTEWVDAYIHDDLPRLVDNYYTYSEIEERMRYLVDNCLTLGPSSSQSDKKIRLAKYKLDLVSNMESLSIDTRRKKRAKKHL